MEHKEIALEDTERAFDNSSFTSKQTAAIDHDTEPVTNKWNDAILNSRNVTATFLEDTIRVSTSRGHP
jgi:hypothetical protein